MDVLVTGSRGFIGRNLIAHLKQLNAINILEYDVESPPALLEEYAAQCGFVFHLAGINRSNESAEFARGNTGFTQILLEALQRHGNKAPVLATSSIQAALENTYGQSKKEAEALLFAHAKETGAPVYVYRLPNVFGKWCRPNYNSVVATFCHNIAHGLPITVNNRETMLWLVYIDDVAAEFIRALEGDANCNGQFCEVEPVHTTRLGAIADCLRSFRESRDTLYLPELADPFVKKLYSTYLSYLPEDGFTYPLVAHTDSRGSFTEFLRSADCGQISVNISKPGVSKGNHWHHSKVEKLMVVSGEGTIRLRALSAKEIITYHLDGRTPQVIDIPPGYVHSIANTGDTDMAMVLWANTCFDPERPDTYALEV